LIITALSVHLAAAAGTVHFLAHSIPERRFNGPVRRFTSVESAYELSIMTVGDYRELIPEFFSGNVFLLNLNKFHLRKIGHCQLNDVEVPSWCRDMLEFVYMHRKVLESDFARQQIYTGLIWFGDSARPARPP
jgi:hypothetical protein